MLTPIDEAAPATSHVWDLSCIDWEERIRQGQSLVPNLPLFADEADMAQAFYDELQLPDVPGKPKMRTASGQWFRDIVRASFGSWDPVGQVRHIRDILALVPKGSSKTTNSAALLLVAMLMNHRPRGKALFVGPTQAISVRAYDQAVGMIEESADLKRRFRTHDHEMMIEDLVTKAEAQVKTFDLRILTGAMGLFFVLLDEIHILGKDAKAGKVLRQIRGGLDKTPEGLLVMTTTQSDDIPAGIFKSELKFARNVRDGKYRGRIIRPMLPVLYEFPKDIATLTREERAAGVEERWKDPATWPMVMPNLGRSIHLPSLRADWESEREKGDDAIKVWASQHLNIEIGVGINNEGWRGADFWEGAVDETLTLETLLERSEVVTIGIDGGGLDDLLGLAVIGRDRKTREWLSWYRAWANPKVLEVRKDIAQQLLDFSDAQEISICPVPQDVEELGAIVAQIIASGLLPEKNAIGIDPNNAAAIIEALTGVGVTDGMLRRLLQGPALAPAMYGLERKLSDGTFWHGGMLLMAFVLGNAKVEQRGNSVMVTKAVSGRAKIDPLIALFQAAILMSWNPSAGRLVTGADILTVI
ncbi:terminase TerL endonuclease subunit [Bradyrhizobium lablabi]|uniref:terminase TerL endonuclease subunit n=1 Tax=Bradyrhizobium lablabi TaxID=722472 RepID=UPI001BA6BE36|nr:terminase TerL endonuclease subunit [Bradyrhizobium lablabi]MBR0695958.1 terminase large subunit [Bradyrhizobium lablabi]